MLLNWLDTRDVVRFAEEIAKEIEGVVADQAVAARRSANKKGEKKFDALITRVKVYAKQKPLNIYKKAKFLNTIKWKLRDSGQNDALIEEIIVLMTVALNG